jgi:hypothetical protein
MKTGRPIGEIAALIASQQPLKKDYIVPTPALQAVVTEDKKDIELAFSLKGDQRRYSLTNHCFSQIADRIGIPMKYAVRMRTEAPQLLATNINHWFANKPEKRMLRTLNNGHNVARAFLSDGYRALDNFDLAAIALPKLREAGCEVHSSEVTETRLYIQASTPKITQIIEQERARGGHTRIQRLVQAGVIISNSEVGQGAILIDPMAYDLVCTNGLIVQRSLRKHHVGRRGNGGVGGDEADTYELYSDETKRLDDKAFWNKVGDVITAAMDEVKFAENVDRLRKTQDQVLAKTNKEAQEVVEVTSNRLNFNDEEKANLLMHFAADGDYSKYGLINAVTRAAQDCESYDRAVELERLGGEIIELAPSNFMAN